MRRFLVYLLASSLLAPAGLVFPVRVGAESLELEYDANGNLIRKGNQIFVWDQENRLILIEQEGKVLAEYVYDGDGNRIVKTEQGKTTKYVGDSFEVSGDEVTKYYFAGAARIAQRQPDGSLLFYHSDHLGGTNVITQASGEISAIYEYFPFGSIKTITGTLEANKLYTGQEYNPETQIYDYKFRHQDPATFVFIKADNLVPDPTNPQDFNRYAYVGGNPINKNDPTGHASTGGSKSGGSKSKSSAKVSKSSPRKASTWSKRVVAKSKEAASPSSFFRMKVTGKETGTNKGPQSFYRQITSGAIDRQSTQQTEKTEQIQQSTTEKMQPTNNQTTIASSQTTPMTTSVETDSGEGTSPEEQAEEIVSSARPRNNITGMTTALIADRHQSLLEKERLSSGQQIGFGILGIGLGAGALAYYNSAAAAFTVGAPPIGVTMYAIEGAGLVIFGVLNIIGGFYRVATGG